MFPNVVRQYLDGIKILDEWFSNDPSVVEVELAERRSKVCLKCPLNQKGTLLTESVAKAIKRKMEEKLCRELHVEGGHELHTCTACSCYLPVKIWFPLRQIYPTEKQKPLFWEKCWLLNE